MLSVYATGISVRIKCSLSSWYCCHVDISCPSSLLTLFVALSLMCICYSSNARRCRRCLSIIVVVVDVMFIDVIDVFRVISSLSTLWFCNAVAVDVVFLRICRCVIMIIRRFDVVNIVLVDGFKLYVPACWLNSMRRHRRG